MHNYMKVIRNNHHKSHEVNSALLPYYNDKRHLLVDHGVASFAYDHWRNETNKTDFKKIWISVATLF